ncbi:MAG: hypothetical protein IJK67_04420 [Bacilli bacterium]|nr:hypothetical protein [Bacilli bacterium]
MVEGYKCFDKGLINRYGEKFEIGKTYHILDVVKFGSKGFHFCKHLEDTLRYFDAIKKEVDICLVQGWGCIDEYEDEYNGFYNMYSTEYLKLSKMLTREEILKYALDLPPYRLSRFISLFKLSEEEIQMIYDKNTDNSYVKKMILYYQYGNKNAFDN